MRYLLTAAALLLFLAGCTTLDNSAVTEKASGPEGYRYAGSIEIEKQYWNWLFLTKRKDRLDELEKLAWKKAAEQYGDDSLITVDDVNGQWNPRSLLMFLDAAGFVEDAGLKASVWLPEEEPPAEAEVEYGIRFRVIPEEDYSSPAGFTNVVYKTREQLETELAAAFAQGDFDEEYYGKKVSRLPESGQIFVTLGREDITNAISRWFTFSCNYKGKTIFRIRGTEDIPYVYGTDRFWWNDKSFKIDFDWEDELLLEINDSYQDKTYNYRIVRERYIIPPDKS